MAPANSTDDRVEMLRRQAEASLAAGIVTIQDFPKPGTTYLDFYRTFYARPQAVAACVDSLEARYREARVDGVVGIGNGGYGVAACVAMRLGAPFHPVRKQSDTVHDADSVSFGMVYAQRELTLARGLLSSKTRVVLVDDSIATGGTVSAGIQLVENAGASVVEVATIFETTSAGGRERIAPVPLFSVISRERY